MAQLQDLEQLIANYQRINQTDVERLEKILPTEQDIAGLFAQLQVLTDEHGFSLESVNINQESEQPGPSANAAAGIKKLTITINVVGPSYPAFKALLDSVEYNLRLLDVNAVYFSPETNNYSVNLFTYYFSDPQ